MNQAITENRLAGAPAEYLEPAVAPTLAEARAYCQHLAQTHYENFHVATSLLPKPLRPHFQVIYAYCRISDDLGDEVHEPATALRLLDMWETMLNEAYDQPHLCKHPVFVALAVTVKERNLPRKPFADLLVAFRRDQTPTVYHTVADIEEYSVYSANPVGELILRVCGYHDEQLLAWSNKICTGLQLANFWQDVGQDLRERNRIYVPVDAMERFGVDRLELRRNECTPQYRAMLSDLTSQTYAMLQAGAPLEDAVDPSLGATLRLFRKGGLAILGAIAQSNFDTLTKRPSISKAMKLRLLLSAAIDHFFAKFKKVNRA